MTDATRYVEQIPMHVGPVTLEGQRARLIPMTRDHVDALFRAADFPAIWEHTGTRPIKTVDDMRRYVDVALAEAAAGTAVPFVTTDPVTGEIIGSTRFANMSLADHRVEIGWTWMRPDRQRTGVNGEAKAMMLRQAFDVWGALRVEIKTDVRNTRSRAAIERIGGLYEGTFRQHMVVRDGRVRDTVYYSIMDYDWRDPNHRAYKNAVSYGIMPNPEPLV
ncbi:MAG TPA: GNAT family protein [Gemmatimonadaceae bacterium]|nr:GNAT family protein [Gemmatimonadaceae bacterium]